MKKMIVTLIALVSFAHQAMALSITRSREEARFLTDKMAYELDLTDDQIQDIYEINYDYFRSLGSIDGFYESYYNTRYTNIGYVLYNWQWDLFCARDYFLRPAYVYRGAWAFGIYRHYHRTHFYYGYPANYRYYQGIHCHASHYYRGRMDMHHRAVAHRGHTVRHPLPGRSDARVHYRDNRPGIGHNNVNRQRNERDKNRGNRVDSRENNNKKERTAPSRNEHRPAVREGRRNDSRNNSSTRESRSREHNSARESRGGHSRGSERSQR